MLEADFKMSLSSKLSWKIIMEFWIQWELVSWSINKNSILTTSQKLVCQIKYVDPNAIEI